MPRRQHRSRMTPQITLTVAPSWVAIQIYHDAHVFRKDQRTSQPTCLELMGCGRSTLAERFRRVRHLHPTDSETLTVHNHGLDLSPPQPTCPVAATSPN
jgi:hypothetical protein